MPSIPGCYLGFVLLLMRQVACIPRLQHLKFTAPSNGRSVQQSAGLQFARGDLDSLTNKFRRLRSLVGIVCMFEGLEQTCALHKYAHLHSVATLHVLSSEAAGLLNRMHRCKTRERIIFLADAFCSWMYSFPLSFLSSCTAYTFHACGPALDAGAWSSRWQLQRRFMA